MLHIKLRRAEFFITAVDHRFEFDVVHNDRFLFTIPVVTADVRGGIKAVFERAHDNLVKVLGLCLESAKGLQSHAGTPQASESAPTSDESPESP